jgi:hypothetical protein
MVTLLLLLFLKGITHKEILKNCFTVLLVSGENIRYPGYNGKYENQKNIYVVKTGYSKRMMPEKNAETLQPDTMIL